MVVKNFVSIITPVYKCEEMVGRTIQSVLAQTFSDWEMILVDDCSPDNAAAVVLSYAEKDDRIRYHKLEENSGAAVTRNTAMQMARGQYIAFLDSDDLWVPEKLEKQINFMKKTGAGFTYTDYAYIDRNDNITRARIRCADFVDYERLTHGSIIMCSSVMLDLEKVGQFSMPLIRSGQDYATWTMLIRTRGIRAQNVGENLSSYRKHEDSLSANKIRAFRRTWRVNREFEKMSFFKCLRVISVYSVHWFIRNYIRKK